MTVYKKKKPLCEKKSSAKETKLSITRGTTLFDNETLSAYPRRFQRGFSVTGETRFRLPKKSSAKLLGGGVMFRRRYALAPTERSLKTDPSEFVSPYKRI